MVTAWIKWMQKMKATSCTVLQQTWKQNLIKRRAAFTFKSVHVRSLKIYEYFMVVFTARAMLSAVLGVVILSVRPSVRHTRASW